MAHRDPSVSVILPTHNRAATITRSIQSVLDQFYQDFELIIVDDKSEDGTSEMVKSFSDGRIKYFILEKRVGAGAARNYGIKKSYGEFIAFQDSDDEWHPDKLAKQLDAFSNHGDDLGVVYSDMVRVCKNGVVLYLRSPTVNGDALINQRSMEYAVSGIGIQSALIRRSCLDMTGIFDETLPAHEDLELFIRLSRNYRFYRIEEALVKYYETEGLSGDLDACARSRKMILSKYSKDLLIYKNFVAKELHDIRGREFLLESGNRAK